MTDNECDFRIYRGNAIPPLPAPVLVVEVRAGGQQFFVQYFLWVGEKPAEIARFKYPRFPAFELDINFGFDEAVQRVEGQLNNSLFEARKSTDAASQCDYPLYSLEAKGPAELFRLQQREDSAYAALQSNATCSKLLDLLDAGGALARFRWLQDVGV